MRAAGEQQAVVHARHDQHRALEVGRHGGQRAAHDAALAAAGVEEPARVDLPGERRVGREALRVDHQPAEEHEVEEALLEAVRERREARQVLESSSAFGHVLRGHPDEVGGADHDVGRSRRAPRRCRTAPRRRTGRGRTAAGRAGWWRCGARDDADEAALLDVARRAHRQAVARPSSKREPGGQPRRSRKHGTVTCPATRRAPGACADLVDAERPAPPSHPQVAQVAVAELRERAVADRQQPLGDSDRRLATVKSQAR